MSDVILVALIVGVTGVITPALLAFLAGRQRREDKREDWARQDAVADQVADAARKAEEVAAQAAGAADLLLAANERVAHTAAVTNEKLDVIHTLVNSNMTAAMQAELTAVEAQRAVLLEVITLKEDSGVSTVDPRATVDVLESRISELRAVLADRLEQTRVANLQAVVQVHTHVTDVSTSPPKGSDDVAPQH